MANIWNSISRQPSHSRKKEKELVVPGGSIKWSKSKNQNITAALRRMKWWFNKMDIVELFWNLKHIYLSDSGY